MRDSSVRKNEEIDFGFMGGEKSGVLIMLVGESQALSWVISPQRKSACTNIQVALILSSIKSKANRQS